MRIGRVECDSSVYNLKYVHKFLNINAIYEVSQNVSTCITKRIYKYIHISQKVSSYIANNIANQDKDNEEKERKSH